MKVLLVSSNFPLAVDEKTSTFISKEAMELAERGVDVKVFRMPFKNFWSSTFSNANLSHSNVQIYEANIRASAISLLIRNMMIFPLNEILHPREIGGVVLYADSLMRMAKRLRVSFLHAHFAFVEGFAACLAKMELKIPLVVTLHGNDILVEPSIGYGIRLQERYDRMVKFVLKNADKVIVASRYVYNEALAICDSPEKLVHIPHGIDLNVFNPKVNEYEVQSKLNLEGHDILLAPKGPRCENGIDFCIQALPMIAEKFPSVVLVVLGNGPLYVRMKNISKRLGIVDRVRFIGEVSPRKIPFFYAAAKIVVIPSLVEGFGISALEAMGCGKPLVASRIGGLVETIRNGSNGFLVRPKDANDIAEKVSYLLERPALARRMGKKGRQIAENNFDIKKRMRKIMDVYNELVSE